MKPRTITQVPHVAIDAAARLAACAHCSAEIRGADLSAAAFCFAAARFVRQHWSCARVLRPSQMGSEIEAAAMRYLGMPFVGVDMASGDDTGAQALVRVDTDGNVIEVGEVVQ